MNDTQFIFLGIIAFGLGWYLAYVVRNIRYLWTRWGWYIGLNILLISFIVGGVLAEQIALENNVILSGLFGLGFVIRFVKQGLRWGE